MSQVRAFCSPHLGWRNAGECLPSPPSATAIRPEVSFAISLWQFVGFVFGLRMCGRVWGIAEGTFTCSEISVFATPAALDRVNWHTRKLLFSWVFSLFPWFFLYKEWKADQFKPIKNSITNHTLFPSGKKTYLCLLKRLRTEKDPNFQPDTWR